MKLEMLLLGLLLQRPMTGYDLKKFVDTAGKHVRPNLQMSQVYRTLGTMHDRGWVSYVVEGRTRGRDAKLYTATADGTTVFLEWLTGPYVPQPNVDAPELGVRLMFAGFMTREELVTLLDTEIMLRTNDMQQYRLEPARTDTVSSIQFDVELHEAMTRRLLGSYQNRIRRHIEWVRRLRDDIISERLFSSEQGDSTDITELTR